MGEAYLFDARPKAQGPGEARLHSSSSMKLYKNMLHVKYEGKTEVMMFNSKSSMYVYCNKALKSEYLFSFYLLLLFFPPFLLLF